MAGVALIPQRSQQYLMLSLLKPLLDDGFRKQIAPAGVDAARGDRTDHFTWYHSYVSSYSLPGIRKGGNDHASPPVGHMMGMPVHP